MNSGRGLVVSVLFLFALGLTGFVEAGATDDSNAALAAIKRGDADEAMRLYIRALESGELSNKDQAIAFMYLGVAHRSKGDLDRAVADFSEAIRLDPRLAPAFYRRGTVWGERNDFDRAIADFNEAIRLDRGFWQAYNHRGVAWQRKRDYDRAIADYQEVIRLNPRHPRALNNLAWLYATAAKTVLHDGRRAVELATRACELDQWKDPEYLDSLAAAYARLGDFKTAIHWQERALADQQFAKVHGDQGRKRLTLYRDGKPFTAE
jgi:tetratricopeptide (TPR) repeat protein